jgi:hypothetical protein
MANIYLLSYLGGGCGEWLSWKISQDANYYDVGIDQVTDNNKFVIVDPLKEWSYSIKSPYDVRDIDITEEIKQGLIEKYSEKNFIIPSHFLGNFTEINLPNVKAVRLRYTYNTCPLFYSLLWIKTWYEPRPLDDKERALVMKCAQGQWSDPVHIRESNVMDKAMEILNRGYYYSFELSALRMGIRSSADYVQRFYGFYFRYNLTPCPGYTKVSLENLMLNPKDTVADWQEAFNMVKPLSISDIEEYHANNIKVIETTFNMPYDKWRESKWILLLKEWVESNCPGLY